MEIIDEVVLKDLEGFSDRYSIAEDGRLYSKVRKRFLRSCRGLNGKRWNRIRDNNGNYKTFFLHRMVAKSFLKPNLSLSDLVFHIDENPDNNHPSNLYIMNRAEFNYFYFYYEGSLSDYLNYLTVLRRAA